MTKNDQKVPENRDQGIFLNGTVKNEIVTVFIDFYQSLIVWPGTIENIRPLHAAE